VWFDYEYTGGVGSVKYAGHTFDLLDFGTKLRTGGRILELVSGRELIFRDERSYRKGDITDIDGMGEKR
jgi:hypothetical protein